MNREVKIYVLQNKKTKKIVAQFDYNYYPAKLKYTDSGLPPYIWSEEEFDLHTEEDIAKEKWIDLSKFEFILVDLAFQDKWQKLKEWLKEQINFDKEEIEENKEIPNLPNRHYLTIENIIIDKMQELEKGEKNVED